MTHCRPALVPVDATRGTLWMILCVPSALPLARWEIGPTNTLTSLPVATKAPAFKCGFYWSDPSGRQVAENDATHVGVLVVSESASETECTIERDALVEAILKCRDATFEQLAIFNH
jgi:hypothetical protein